MDLSGDYAKYSANRNFAGNKHRNLKNNIGRILIL